MPPLSQSIDNILNGVSQAPAHLRLASHANEQRNALDSVARGGKSKRPPTEHVAKLTSVPKCSPYSAHLHTINRDVGSKFRAVFLSGDVRVFKADTGAEVPVSFHTPDKKYLNTPDPEQDIRCVTVGDTTYVANKSVVVAKGTATRLAQREEAYVIVTQVDFGKYYAIRLFSPDFTQYGYIGGNINTSSNASRPQDISTQVVLQQLYDMLTSIPLFPSYFNIEILPGSLYIYRKDGGTFTIKVEDGLSGAGMHVVKGSVQRFDQLPKTAKPTTQIEIAGDPSNQFDNYWVTYIEPFGASEGQWRESLAPGALEEFDADTLPHRLVQLPDGTFVFDTCPWHGREAGDDQTNPFPSIAGKGVSSLFFYQGRLGMTAEESVVLSKAGDAHYLFRTTVTDLLADDPIDVKVSGKRASHFHAAMEWQGEPWLWTRNAQFLLSGDPVLTPQTVRLDGMTHHENAPECPPLVSGSRLFFARANGQAVRIQEWLTDGASIKPAADDITVSVPSYIRGRPAVLVADDVHSFLGVITRPDPISRKSTRFFAHTFHFQNGQRVQSSWSEWAFDSGAYILAADCIDGVVGLIVRRPKGIFLEKIDLDMWQHMDDFEPIALSVAHLDRRMMDTDACVTVTYKCKKTYWKIPFCVAPDGSEGKLTVVCADSGKIVPTTQPFTDVICAVGDWRTKSVFIGLAYEFYYEPSTIYMRDARTGDADLHGRLTLRTLTVRCAETTDFTVEVTDPSGNTWYTERSLKEPTSDDVRVPVLQRADEVTCAIADDSPGAVLVGSLAWEGTYHARTRKV